VYLFFLIDNGLGWRLSSDSKGRHPKQKPHSDGQALQTRDLNIFAAQQTVPPRLAFAASWPLLTFISSLGSRSIPRSLVERLYARSIFPALSHVVRRFGDLVSFSLAGCLDPAGVPGPGSVRPWRGTGPGCKRGRCPLSNLLLDPGGSITIGSRWKTKLPLDFLPDAAGRHGGLHSAGLGRTKPAIPAVTESSL
jgi:hypothetical protein